MLTFYYAPHTCSLATHIALEDAGADYKPVRLSFAKDEQRKPDYLAVNPKARVPSLVTERGVLTETPALLAYVAQRYPEARLAPLDDAFAFAEAQAVNSYLCSTVHVAHAHKQRGYRWADDAAAQEAMRRKVPQTVGDCFALIEREILRGPWVMGEAYTICDPYLYTVSLWLEADGVDIARFPKVEAHFRAMAERPSARRALAEELG